MIGELNAEFLKKGDCSSLLLLAYTIWKYLYKMIDVKLTSYIAWS